MMFFMCVQLILSCERQIIVFLLGMQYITIKKIKPYKTMQLRKMSNAVLPSNPMFMRLWIQIELSLFFKIFKNEYRTNWDSLVAQLVKNPPANAEDLGFDPWGGKIPWRREQLPTTPVFWTGKFHGLIQSVGSQRVRHYWVASTFTFFIEPNLHSLILFPDATAFTIFSCVYTEMGYNLFYNFPFVLLLLCHICI